MKKQLLAMILSIVMVVALFPGHAFAAVEPGDRPSNPSNNLVIGILDDDRADGVGEFPNEPSVTGYDYYYLQSDLSLSTSFMRANFTSNGGNYINTTAFWNDDRINKNAEGDAFGYYSPTGLDLENDDFFVDGIENTIVENTIISNWLRAEGITGANVDDYDLLFYVLKYETGWSSGYHLDAKVVRKNNVTLSYDANKPANINTDITLPSSSSVEVNASVTVSDMSSAAKTLYADGLTYVFTEWNTQADGEGEKYESGDSITVSQNTVLYAQWKVANTYTVTWVNYDGSELYKVSGLPYGEKVDPEDDYEEDTPTKPSDSHNSYSFTEWNLISGTYDDEIGITEDLIYEAQYESQTIAHKATVGVVLNGTFDTNGNRDENDQGELIDIEDVVASAENELYLKLTNGTGEYITLERKSEGIYSNEAVLSGDYYIYIKSEGAYTQVGTQALTIANADRTRYLPYYSVEYFDGVNSEALAIEYYYIGSKVNVSTLRPEDRDGYIFLNWNDGTEVYNPSTALATVELTDNITNAYELTAQWDEAAKVNVTVVVDHNGRESDVEEALTVHLTSKNESTGNYNEVANTSKSFGVDDWYTDNTTGDITIYEAGALYTNLSPDGEYGIHAAIPGYRTYTDRAGGYIEISKNDNEYNITYYLIYDPDGYELPFTVKIDSETPERMIPQAVDVKVTRWNEDEEKWEPIPQHENESVEVVIDKDTLTGEGSVHVWGFAGNDRTDPYIYRIKVVRIDLGDYQLTVTDGDTTNVDYKTVESGFFPEGAYTAIVEVNADKSEGGLAGAHAVEESGQLAHHGEIVATVSVHPYTVMLNPNGGQWSESDSDVKTVENRFTVPDLSEHVPTKTGETFDGWYLDDDTTKVTSGEYIHDYINGVGGTLELHAKWKPDLTVKGTVVVELGFPCNDDSRTVTVALQMRKEGGTYDVTNFTQSVPLTPVGPDNEYATGTYEFTNVPDIGQYRVNVIVAGGTITYQNEPESLDANNLYNSTMYNSDDFTAETDGDTEAVVNIYMKAALFDLGYKADTSAIAEDFRPTDLKLDLRHDHRDDDAVSYEVIKDDISIESFTEGVSGISTVEVPQYHANGYLYDYVISVLSYDIDEMDWVDRHYYHYEITDGYEPAPFTIQYNGPANYSEDVNTDGLSQDVTLTATFVPNTYAISYDLQYGTWADADHIGPSHHTWGVDTSVDGVVPVRSGHIFTGWTAEVSETYDAENKKIPAKVWQDVKLTANWETDVWTDDDTNGDKYDQGDGVPDKYQVAISYASNNIEYGTVDKIFEIVTLPGEATTGNVTASATATTQGSNTKFNKWTFDGATVSTDAVLNYVIEGAIGGNRYDFVADFGVQGGGGGGGGVIRYTLTYETNGGNAISKETYNSGKNVKLTKVPVREGYIFDGWHIDETLIEDVSEVKMTKDITVYADWVKDNGSAGNGYKTPDSLNGEDHFAYVVGYTDGTVRPNANILRSEVTAIFFRLLKDEIRNANLSDTNGFSDISSDAWHNTAVSTMSKLGIVQGKGNNIFDPNAFITRAEFAAICARFDDSEFEVVDDFTDVKGHWAENEIHEAAAHGWIRGYEDNTFKPNQLITRAEAMTMINRVLNRVPETADDLLDNMIKWPDNSNESVWYYLPVQEATNSHEYDMKNHIYEKWTAITDGTNWLQYQ